jgi:hypothetical protein
MNDTPLSGDSTNPDLRKMHSDLIGLVQSLEQSIDSAPTAAAITAITEQMVEVNARVTAIGRVLLAQQTEEIARNAKAVAEAMPGIEEEIADLQNCQRMVRSVATLLGAVDNAVRLATLACD